MGASSRRAVDGWDVRKGDDTECLTAIAPSGFSLRSAIEGLARLAIQRLPA